MSLSTILQKGHTLGEDHEGVSQSVEHLTKCLDKFLNKEGGSYAWSAELNAITGVWNKLALGYKENIPDSEMSYKALNEALPNILTDGNLPAEIEGVIDEPEAPVEEKVAEIEHAPEEEAHEEAADFAAGFDVFGSGDDDDGPPAKAPEPAPKVEEQKKDDE